MNDKQLLRLFDKYLSGTASQEELEFIEGWFRRTGAKVPPVLSDQQREHIRTDIYRSIEKRIDPEPVKSSGRLIKVLPFLFKAAALLGFALLFYGSYEYLKTGKKHGKTREVPVFTELHVPAGQKAKITLPDSSTIWLNGRSSIRYSKTFDKIREVYLDKGEAFFEVKHDKQRPFVVHSAGIDTRVLGTSFNISAGSREEDFVLCVSTGRVLVSESQGNRRVIDTVTRGYRLNYRRKDGGFSKNTADVSNYTAWKDNLLVFKDATWTEIKSKIENWYDVEVIFQGTRSGKQLFTAAYRDKPLREVLESLRDINSFHYRIDNRKVFISH
ncbi:FecR family protein [Pedobacter sp. SYSU D00535]|uniref:FecR family protein n=1 Tax=Pedobacter sp. SYSU D00535 TaxID=2810308 RepID=UPI001A9578D0|nr:FecR family protein [Pedobacter sp. SYSU D00535]